MCYAERKGEKRKGRDCISLEMILPPSVNRDMFLIELFMTVNIGFINCMELIVWNIY